MPLVGLLGAAPQHARPAFGPPPPPTPYDLCEAAVTAARTKLVPESLLPAIARVESGRPDPVLGRVRPWPWTINVGGSGSFFDSKAEAIAAVHAFQDKGVHSIDVGCLQVNLMFHPTAFATLDDAFDPAINAAYATRFLTSLFTQTKDWNLAAAYYHSQTQAFGEDYQRRLFGRVMTPMGPAGSVLPAPAGSVLPAPAGTVLPAGNPYGAFLPQQSTYGAIPPRSLAFGAFAAPADTRSAFGMIVPPQPTARR